MRKFVLIPQHVYSSSFGTMSQQNEHNIRNNYINTNDNAVADNVFVSDPSEPWKTTEHCVVDTRNLFGSGSNNHKKGEVAALPEPVSTQTITEKVVIDDDPLNTLRSLVKQRILLQRQRKETLALFRIFVANSRLIVQGNSVRLDKNLFVPYHEFVELLRYAAASRKSSKPPKHSALFLQKLHEIPGMDNLLASHLRVNPVRRIRKRKIGSVTSEEEDKRNQRMKRLCKKSAARLGVQPSLKLPF